MKFLHLACISNDNSFELDEKLSASINLAAFEPMVIAAKNANIKDSSMHQLVQYTEFLKKKKSKRIIL